MESDTGDRKSEGEPDLQGAAEPRVDDIFDTIAARAFARMFGPLDPDDLAAYTGHMTIVAEEYRIAMSELHVEVKPEGPKPDPRRTKNGTLMLLFGALECGDIWIKDTHVPVRKHDDGTLAVAGSIIKFLCGIFDVEIQFLYNVQTREMTFQRVLAVTLENGQRLGSDHHNRRWLANYTPAVDLDVFSPALQSTLDKLALAPGEKAWTVIGHDHLGRSYKWPLGRAPVIWKDARGREL